jgi:hypothetical protein
MYNPTTLASSDEFRMNVWRTSENSVKTKFNREGHSSGPFDQPPPNRSARLYSVTGAMPTSGGFSAAYPALYLR